ncbi:MAG: right-handed parallel beta-helix repeat-containing protein [Phycisphaerae bacterium]|nr:right-handed parallel beta-helix repeat-containing protein [Phycisphaerae bacterium]
MNTIVETINAAGRAFVGFSLPMLIQSSVLIVILLGVDAVLRRKVRAVFRYWIWLLVLAKLVLPPSLGSPMSVGTWFGDKLEVPTMLPFEPEPPSAEPSPLVSAILSAPDPMFRQPPLSPPQAAGPTAPPPTVEASAPVQTPMVSLSWQGLTLLAWAAVAIALTLLLVQRAFFVRGLVGQAQEANRALLDAMEDCRGRLGLRRRIGLRLSPNASSPAVCGLLHPTVLIPQSLAPRLHSHDLHAVLLHELAHVKRGDLWVNLAQTLLQIAYFYNPLLWLANAMIRRTREQAVDETVLVAMGETAKQYPEILVNIAKLAFRRRPALSLRLIGVVESKSALTGRIKHILSRPIPKTAKLGIVGLLVIGLVAAILLPMAADERSASPPDVDQEQPSIFTRTLPNGVTVELLGVCEHPGEGKSWWRPDGDGLLAEIPYRTGRTTLAPSPEDVAYKFAVRLHRVPRQGLGSIMVIPSLGTLAGNIPSATSGRFIDDLYWAEVALPRGQQECSICCVVATGAWETTARMPVEALNGQGVTIRGVTFSSPADDPETDATISVSCNIGDWLSRVVAVTAEGRVIGIPSVQCNRPPQTRIRQAIVQFPGLTLAEIEEFQFQRRPWRWVEFENVSLQPGHKTDVRINAASEDVGDAVPEGMVGTWRLENPEGDDQQMAVFPDGRVLVLYPDGHEDRTHYCNGFLTLGNHGCVRVQTILRANGTILQYLTGEDGDLFARRWRRVAAQPTAGAISREIVLPDVDHEAVMLDLATGQFVPTPRVEPPERLLETIKELGKGDLVLDGQSLILVRGATSKQAQEGPEGLVKIIRIGSPLPQIVTVTAADGTQYRIDVRSVDDKACTFTYSPISTAGGASGGAPGEPATPDTKPSDSGLVARLANGVTIELLGVCEHPNESNQWWRADGLPLQKAPCYNSGLSRRPSREGTVYAFAIRMDSVPEGMQTVVAIPSSHALMSSDSSQDEYGRLIEDIWWVEAVLPEVRRTCTVRCEVGNRTWVEFQGVSLQPGRKTRVEVRMEPRRPYAGTSIPGDKEEQTRANAPAREILLPEVNRRRVILDLATGKLLPLPSVETEPQKIQQALRTRDKGDVVYDVDLLDRTLVLLRDATSEQGWAEIGKSFTTGYFVARDVPETLNVTTREGRQYEITVLSANPHDCTLRYSPISADRDVGGDILAGHTTADAATAANASDSGLVAQLANGVTITLLAYSRLGEAGLEWWTPRGERTAIPGVYEADVEGHGTVLALRAEPMPEVGVFASLCQPPDVKQELKPVWRVGDGDIWLVPLGEGRSYVNVELMAQVRDPIVAKAVAREGFSLPVGFQADQQGAAWISDVNQVDSDSTAFSAPAGPDAPGVVAALDVSGQVHSLHRVRRGDLETMYGLELSGRRRYETDIPLDRFAGIVVEGYSERAALMRLGNLSLRPGQPTQVRVEVEPGLRGPWWHRSESDSKLDDFCGRLVGYAEAHGGSYPANESALRAVCSDELWTWLQGHVVYLGAGKSPTRDEGVPIAYERTLLSFGFGTHMLYSDGNVEFVVPSKLKELGIPTGDDRRKQGDPDAKQKMNQLALAINKFADNHQGNLPVALSALSSYLDDPQTRAWLDENVTYVGKGNVNRRGAGSIVTAFERNPQPTGERYVLFLDYHIELAGPQRLAELNIENAGQVKGGPLEFRIAVDLASLDSVAIERYQQALVNGNNPPEADFAWFPTRAGMTGFPQVPAQEREGTTYVLLWNKPPHVILPSQDWGLDKVYRTTDANGRSAIGLTLNQKGASLFHDITAVNVGRPLAILVHGEVVSMPHIMSPLDGRSALITGSLTEREVADMMATLRPVRETTTDRDGATAGPLGRYTLSFDGVDDCLIVPASPSLRLKPPFFIEVWARPDYSAPSSSSPEDRTGALAMCLIRQGRELRGASRPEVDETEKANADGWPPLPRDRVTLTNLQSGGFMGLVRGGFFAVQENGKAMQTGILRKNQLGVDRAGWQHFYVSLDDASEYVPSDGPLVIGGDLAPHIPAFKGQIAEIRIWNGVPRGRDTRYVGTTSVTGTEPNLVACWTFEEGTGQIVRDISRNGNHARLGNSGDADDADPTWIDLMQTDPVAARANVTLTLGGDDPLGLFYNEHGLWFELDNHGSDSVEINPHPLDQDENRRGEWGYVEVLAEDGTSVTYKRRESPPSVHKIPPGKRYKVQDFLNGMPLRESGPGVYKVRLTLRVRNARTDEVAFVPSNWHTFRVTPAGRWPDQVRGPYVELREAEAFAATCNYGHGSHDEAIQRLLSLAEKYTGTKYALEAYFTAADQANTASYGPGDLAAYQAKRREYHREIVKRWPDVVNHYTIYARLHTYFGMPESEFIQSRRETYRWLLSITEEQKIASIRAYGAFTVRPSDEPTDENLRQSLLSLNQYISQTKQMLETSIPDIAADASTPPAGSETLTNTVRDATPNTLAAALASDRVKGRAEGGLAWQRTDRYVPPDPDGFFPDDPEGGKRLDSLFQAVDKDARSDDEILSTVRQGFRRTTQHRTLVLSWIGNRYIWNKDPQNAQAIEIMYHAAPLEQHYAVYFGLSVTRHKTPNILRTLADICMRGEEVGRITWGLGDQRDAMLAYITPHLQDSDPDKRQTAELLVKHFKGELDFEQWQREKRDEQARARLGDQLPQIRQTLLAGDSEARRQAFVTLARSGGSVLDDSFLPALQAAASDPSSEVRNDVVRTVGGRWIWSAQQQDPNAIALTLRLSSDSDREVRYNAVYYGLSTVRDKSDAVVRRLVEMALAEHENNLYGRIVWGLKGPMQATPASFTQALAEHLDRAKADLHYAASVYQLHRDVLGTEPADDWGLARVRDRYPDDLFVIPFSAREPFKPADADALWTEFSAALPAGVTAERLAGWYDSRATVCRAKIRGKERAEAVRTAIENHPRLRAGEITPLTVPMQLFLEERGSPASTRAQVASPQPRAESGTETPTGPGPIQQKIDAAAPGDTIRLEAGTYHERLRIDKPLTLEGAGWDKTTVTMESRMPESKEQAADLAALSVLSVVGTRDVTIRGIKFTAPGRRLRGASLPTAVVSLNRCGAWLTDCAVIGGPGDGIHVLDESNVAMQRCLVAAVWGTGVRVGSPKDVSEASIADSDIRNCHYAGIRIAKGNQATVERCRVSGAAWHGIRYDDASPVIAGNLIFASARSGIYASGRTQATIKGNLFWANEMCGMSCWFQDNDRIEGNTFVQNKRSGLEIIGASKPDVRNNIFYASPAGVSLGDVADDSPFAKSDGAAPLEGNIFWTNEQAIRRGGGAVTEQAAVLDEKAGVSFDPRFVAPDARDFSLRADSPARKKGIGAADLIPFASPWPIQPEESAIIPRGDTRDSRQWRDPLVQ